VNESLLALVVLATGVLLGALLAVWLRPKPEPPPVLLPAEPFDRIESRLRDLDTARARAQGEVDLSLRTLLTQTANLTQALRAPQVRGRWGEIQLRRVVELAGMVQHVDFTEQTTVRTEDGRLRPDVLVRLPAGRLIVIDAKTPLKAYLESLETADEAARLRKIQEHATQVRTHLLRLAEKNYWRQFEQAPEFVVCFLPGETFFSAALEQDPALIETGAQQRVILATPTTLIALLKAVAYGWQQERVAESAQEVSELGRQLYERLATMTDHFARLGDSLAGSVKNYNQTLASLESRVLATARKFEDLGAAGPKPLRNVDPVDQRTRDPRQGGLGFPDGKD
jgi:DNA recombination protein RmuC